jgi:alkanesulfonate monooxygenase SsuD/methylene tetrahydromethanopterin reductase-like flavin-dependent oxidoreductase (luciferase family)
MVQLWTAERPHMEGRYVRFADIDAHPRPVRDGGPRIVVGGHSDAAFRRALTRAHGWFGVGTPDELAGNLARLRRVADAVERPARLGRLEVTADRFADLGVDRLLVYPLPLEDPDDIARFLDRHAGLAR